MSDVCVKYMYKKDICYSYYEYIFVIVTEAKVMKSSSSMEIVIKFPLINVLTRNSDNIAR